MRAWIWSYRACNFLMACARGRLLGLVGVEYSVTEPFKDGLRDDKLLQGLLANSRVRISWRVYGSGHFPRLPVQW